MTKFIVFSEENVPFIPDSRLTVPDEEKSGWFGLRNFHCTPDAIPGVNVKSFYEDLVALKQAQAQSLSPKPKSVHFS